MKKHLLFIVLVIGILFLAGCGKEAVDEGGDDDIPLPPEPTPPGQLAAEDLDVLTVAECEALQGAAVNTVGGYDCEQGETAVGAIEELTGDHLCCVA